MAISRRWNTADGNRSPAAGEQNPRLGPTSEEDRMSVHRASGAARPERRTSIARSAVCRPLSVAALALATSIATHADTGSYTAMLQNNAMRQANLTQQMINLGGRPIGAGGAAAPAGPAPCLPPVDLQRGVDGHVPPELQGDPRYQAYLRCRQAHPERDVRTMPQAPAAAGAHLPITATDFVPPRPGHPLVDEAIAGLAALTPEQRMQLRNGAEELFRRVATQYRGNNLAVSVTVAYAAAALTLNGTEMNAQQARELVLAVNDQLARHPRFATMTALQKQNESDRLIYQTFVIAVLRELGTRDPQARQQATDLARAMMKQFNGA